MCVCVHFPSPDPLKLDNCKVSDLVIFALDLGNEIRDEIDTGYLGSATKVLKCVSPYHTGVRVF